MCLDNVYPKKKRETLIAKHQKEKYIYVWKVFTKYPNGHFGLIRCAYQFFRGKNKTKITRKGMGYKMAYHSFLHKETAIRWSEMWIDTKNRVVKCKVLVKSITAVGKQNFYNEPLSPVIVSTEIICPKYFGSKK